MNSVNNEPVVIMPNDVNTYDDCCYCKDNDWFIKTIPQKMLIISSKYCFSESLKFTIGSYDPIAKKIINETQFINGLAKVGAWKIRIHLMLLYSASLRCITGETRLYDDDYGLTNDQLHALEPKLYSNWLTHYINNEKFYNLSYDWGMYQYMLLVVRQILPWLVLNTFVNDLECAKLIAFLLYKIKHTFSIIQKIEIKKQSEPVPVANAEHRRILKWHVDTEFLDFQGIQDQLNSALARLYLQHFQNYKKSKYFHSLCSKKFHKNKLNPMNIDLYWIDQNLKVCSKLYEQNLPALEKEAPGATYNEFMFSHLKTLEERLQHSRQVNHLSTVKHLFSHPEFRRQWMRLLQLFRQPSMYQLLSNTCSLKQCLWYGCHKKSVKLRKCKHCNSAFYCSRKCQKQHWSKHRIRCRRSTDRDMMIQILLNRTFMRTLS